MSVKIRLRRMGKKKQPHYRIVVADSRSPRDGRFVEILGFYNPITHPAQLRVDLERVDYWLGEGAIASHTVGNLVTRARAGGDEKVALVGDGEQMAAPAEPADGPDEAAEVEADEVEADEVEPEAGEAAEAAAEPEPAAEPVAEASEAPEAAAENESAEDASGDAGESADDSAEEPDDDAGSSEASADEDPAE